MAAILMRWLTRLLLQVGRALYGCFERVTPADAAQPRPPHLRWARRRNAHIFMGANIKSSLHDSTVTLTVTNHGINMTRVDKQRSWLLLCPCTDMIRDSAEQVKPQQWTGFFQQTCWEKSSRLQRMPISAQHLTRLQQQQEVAAVNKHLLQTLSKIRVWQKLSSLLSWTALSSDLQNFTCSNVKDTCLLAETGEYMVGKLQISPWTSNPHTWR